MTIQRLPTPPDGQLPDEAAPAQSAVKEITGEAISDVDITKFQLLGAYVGMRQLEKEKLEKEQEALSAKLELADKRIDDARDQAREYNQFMREKYKLTASDQINYATGEIKRGAPPDEPQERNS